MDGKQSLRGIQGTDRSRTVFHQSLDQSRSGIGTLAYQVEKGITHVISTGGMLVVLIGQ